MALDPAIVKLGSRFSAERYGGFLGGRLEFSTDARCRHDFQSPQVFPMDASNSRDYPHVYGGGAVPGRISRLHDGCEFFLAVVTGHDANFRAATALLTGHIGQIQLQGEAERRRAGGVLRWEKGCKYTAQAHMPRR